MPAAPTDLRRRCSTGPRPRRPRRRRPDARPFRDRPRRSHFARSAGAGGAVRSRELPPRRRRQRRAQRRGARRQRGDRRARRATMPKARGWSPSCARPASAPPASIADRDRCTTRKLRVVTTRNQQVARIDYECDAPSTATLEAALAQEDPRGRGARRRRAHLRLPEGRRSRRLTAQAAIEAAQARGVPSLVDPKVPHIDYYAGASLITPNHHEAEAVTLHADPHRAEARPRRSASASAPAATAC